MFCLRRAEFPVDTHVWKIALALKWVPKNADREQTYEYLNAKIPDEIKYDLHVLLVEHGKCYKNGCTELRKGITACLPAFAALGDAGPGGGPGGAVIKAEVVGTR